MPTNPFEPPKEVGRQGSSWPQGLSIALVAALGLFIALAGVILLFVASLFVSEWLRLAL